MKICMNFIIFLIICPGGYTYYDWNVTASELSNDFTNELKLEADLHKELQTDLLKMSKLPESYLSRNTFISDPIQDLWQSHQEYSNADNIDTNSYTGKSDSKMKNHKKQQHNGYDNRDNKANGHQKHHGHHHPPQSQHHNHHNTYDNDHDNHNRNQEQSIDICQSETGSVADTDEDEEGDYGEGDDSNDGGDDKEDGGSTEGDTSTDETEMKSFVGTNLFENARKNCFSIEDVALLTARKDFEILLPKKLPPTLLNDRLVSVIMNYFYFCHEIIAHETNDNVKRIAQKAFYDALGGFLNYYIVPVTKFSFYSGQVSLQTVENVILLHKQCKRYLNVNGNGWKAPIKDITNKLKDIHIEPWNIANNKSTNEPSFCMQLDTSCSEQEAEDDKMIVSLPKLEPEDRDNLLGNIWIPFKRKRIFNLRAENSMYAVVKYYETVTRCYQFQKINQDYFNLKFKNWIFENVYVHLSDDILYPGLGAILRIYEGLKRSKKTADFEDSLKETIEDLARVTSSGPYVKRLKKSHKEKDNSRAENRTSKKKLKKMKLVHTRNQTVKTQQVKVNKAPNINIEIKVPSELTMAQSLLAAANATETAVTKEFLRMFTINSPLSYIVFAVPVILIIIIIAICLKKGKKKKVIIQKPTPPKSPKKKVKGSSDSIKTNSSEVICQPLSKCTPFSHKRRGPALIETTSLDYTSSEAEDKKAGAKSKSKTDTTKGKEKVTSAPAKAGKTPPAKAPPAKSTPAKPSPPPAKAAKGTPVKQPPAKK